MVMTTAHLRLMSRAEQVHREDAGLRRVDRCLAADDRDAAVAGPLAGHAGIGWAGVAASAVVVRRRLSMESKTAPSTDGAVPLPGGRPAYIEPWLRPTTWPSASATIASHVSGAGLNFGATTVPPSAVARSSDASRSGTLT